MRSTAPLVGLFAIAGGAIGFFLRPTDILGQQLPLSMVLSRGANLQGLDRLLIPLAQRSFNEMAAGLLIGAVLGVVVAALGTRR